MGANWSSSNIVTTNFDSVFLSGSNGIAGSASNDGLYYSTNSGANWTQSNIVGNNFYTVALSGTNAIAASSVNDIGIYYSLNSGVTWIQSSRTSGTFNSVVLSGLNGIAGSNSGIGANFPLSSGIQNNNIGIGNQSLFNITTAVEFASESMQALSRSWGL